MRHLRKQKPFEEKRELWRSKLDKPIGPGMMITLIPTLTLGVFAIALALPVSAVRSLSRAHRIRVLCLEGKDDNHYTMGAC